MIVLWSTGEHIMMPVQRSIAIHMARPDKQGLAMGMTGSIVGLGSLAGNYLVALLIIYLLMVAIFTHWGYPLLIMTSIPLGIAGGIVGLWLVNAVGATLPLVGLSPVTQPFDMISMLGFLILMGTVVNNPILIVHRAVQNADRESMAPLEAVEEAIRSRLRPIAMSTITTICNVSDAPLFM